MTRMQVRSLSYWKVRHWYASLVKPRTTKPPYQHVIQIGDPRLRSNCKEVPKENIQTPEVQSLIKHMQYVLNRYNCVGLSAPQVGVDLKLFVMEFQQKHAKRFSKSEFQTKEMTYVPFTVVINPSVKIVDFNKVVFSESCESVKGFWADVPRYRALQLSGLNENGEDIVVNANGWIARIIQHEMDHLSGKLYTDIMDRNSLTCSCWEAVNERRGKVILPFSPD